MVIAMRKKTMVPDNITPEMNAAIEVYAEILSILIEEDRIQNPQYYKKPKHARKKAQDSNPIKKEKAEEFK